MSMIGMRRFLQLLFVLDAIGTGLMAAAATEFPSAEAIADARSLRVRRSHRSKMHKNTKVIVPPSGKERPKVIKAKSESSSNNNNGKSTKAPNEGPSKGSKDNDAPSKGSKSDTKSSKTPTGSSPKSTKSTSTKTSKSRSAPSTPAPSPLPTTSAPTSLPPVTPAPTPQPTPLPTTLEPTMAIVTERPTITASEAPTEMPPAGDQCTGDSIRLVQFWLRNAETESRLQPIVTGDTLILDALAVMYDTTLFNIEMETDPPMVGKVFVQSNMNLGGGNSRTENEIPYLVGDTDAGGFQILNLNTGQWNIVGTPFCMSTGGQEGDMGPPASITFLVSQSGEPVPIPAVTQFFLLRASNQERLLAVNNGDNLQLDVIQNAFGTTEFQLEAATSLTNQVVQVDFSSNMPLDTTQDTSTPFTTPSAAGASITLTPGSWEISATPFSSGLVAGTSKTTTFTVEGDTAVDPTNEACSAESLGGVVQFVLVPFDGDAEDTSVVINPDDVIDLQELSSTFDVLEWTIEAIVDDGDVGAMGFQANKGLPDDPALDIMGPPFTASQTAPISFVDGSWQVTAIPFCDASMTIMGTPMMISFSVMNAGEECVPEELDIGGFALYDIAADEPVVQIFDGDEISLEDLGELSSYRIDVTTQGNVGSVAFTSNMPLPETPSFDVDGAPFSVPSTASGASLTLLPGEWMLTAVPFCGTEMTSETMGTPGMISFVVSGTTKRK